MHAQDDLHVKKLLKDSFNLSVLNKCSKWANAFFHFQYCPHLNRMDVAWEEHVSSLRELRQGFRGGNVRH